MFLSCAYWKHIRNGVNGYGDDDDDDCGNGCGNGCGNDYR